MRATLVALVGVIATALGCHDAPVTRDAAPVAIESPVPRAPAHGAMLAEAPRFRWEPVAGVADVTYQLQIDGGCAGRPLSSCAPIAPAIDVVVAATSWRGALPAGRWAWRVRACAAATCSPWTRLRR